MGVCRFPIIMIDLQMRAGTQANASSIWRRTECAMALRT